MINRSDLIRGCTDTVILKLLKNGDSYGYEINKTVSELSHGELELKEATLYTSFRRLESGGYIASYWGDEMTGARRRYYAITDTGKKLLDENLNDWNQAKAVIDTLLTSK